jgi:hypothetical protein|tara:strand:- start:944 stop:1588 length:645 start_codon:yes stop_codon:yes gene_type:complete
MTYLQLVNSVLRRLREDEVTSVSQNSYSKLIGEFVNDSKRTVEDAYDWTALRDTLTVSTDATAFNYTLVGSGNRMKILDVANDTSNFFLQYRTSHWMNNAFLINDAPTGTPQFYSFNGVDANGDNGVDLYPKPDGVYQVRFNAVLRTDDFTVDTDNMLIPSSPVVQLATALGARERGETGGTSAAELFALADRTLADAIAFDAAQHPEETIWYS